MKNPAPELSVILPTDTLGTILPVLESLRRQTIASQLEVILVSPSPGEFEDAILAETSFASMRVVGCESLSPLGVPRAAGIRSACAPFVFVGETHSFLQPDAAGRLLDAIRGGPWAVVVPGFESANPAGIASWAAFLADYSRWSARLPPGAISEPPLYDCACRRDVLLGLGDHLATALTGGDDLRRWLQARGLRVLFEPSARISHLNIESPRAWVHEHFLNGVLVGSVRARRWRWRRRLAYMACSWMIPAILLWRTLPGMWRVAAAERVPVSALGASALLLFIRAAGEFCGYAGWEGSGHDAARTHYEIRRADYAVRSA